MSIMDLDLSSNSSFNSTLSLYIPLVEENLTEDIIKTVFQNQNLGKVLRVDFIYNKFSKRQVFIHFKEWYENSVSSKLQKKIMDPKQKALLNFETDDSVSKSWLLLANRNPRQTDSSVIDKLNNRVFELENKLNLLLVDSEPNNGKRSRHVLNHITTEGEVLWLL